MDATQLQALLDAINNCACAVVGMCAALIISTTWRG